MALSLPTDRRLIAAELPRLVEAVQEAHVREPETTAVEWKRAMNLKEVGVRFDLAQHVLGFANRSVAVAARSFAGYAYLLIGVAPGEPIGADVPDPAILDDALARFIAPGRPHWELQLAELDRQTVAVIEIAPPHPGDRIATLQRGHAGAAPGRIYVRRAGKTVEASPDEVRMLEDRFAEPTRAAEAREAERHNVELRRLTIEEERARYERLERAERSAANFVPSRRSPGLALDSAAHRLSGMVMNAGGPATVADAILHPPTGGAFPGALAVVYGSGPVADPQGQVRVDAGVDLLLGFTFPHLAALSGSTEPLSVTLRFVDDEGVEGDQVLTLRRDGADAQGRDLWTVRPAESRRTLEVTRRPQTHQARHDQARMTENR